MSTTSCTVRCLAHGLLFEVMVMKFVIQKRKAVRLLMVCLQRESCMAGDRDDFDLGLV